MSVDAFIDGLGAEATETMRRLLRNAYDRGFREALATSGAPAPEVAAAPTPVVAWNADPPIDEKPSTSVEWGDEPEGTDEPEPEEAAPVRPIMAHASIATLRKRIFKTFDLERFEIDVVICRKGDRDRRQLKSTARLASYRKED